MKSADQSQMLIEAISEAYASKTSLAIHGGNTKTFYGRPFKGIPLSTREHRGVIRYEPTELVITARSGTPLIEIERLLNEHRQMLPFEPPHFGENATVGGMVAAGLSGPRRPYAGAVRDNVLGVVLINGKGERLRFGGEVMKNVAGYDIARTMAGALGTLGVLLEISLKVLPHPPREITLVQSMPPQAAILRMSTWSDKPLPTSATWYDGRDLYIRLSGSELSLRAAATIIGGDQLDWSEVFWKNIQEQSEFFFMDNARLWRLSVPPATPPLSLPGDTVMEWNGALRWLKSETMAALIRIKVAEFGGHATLYRGGDSTGEVFHPLSKPLMRVHSNLKKAFDPHGILNPQRMYTAL
jgi:glycolate oxidase FAD binding subunit